jgi:hypothetical protein
MAVKKVRKVVIPAAGSRTKLFVPEAYSLASRWRLYSLAKTPPNLARQISARANTYFRVLGASARSCKLEGQYLGLSGPGSLYGTNPAFIIKLSGGQADG